MISPEAFTSALAHTLQSLRKEQGLSMEELAVKAGITRPAISMYESEDRNPSVLVLYRIASALGMKTSELIQLAEEADSV
jgi:transcriptional regulator with XRE-family HTH domain